MLADLLLRAGKAGAVLGAELDVARAVGPRRAWSQWRDDSAGSEDELYRSLWGEAAAAAHAEVHELAGSFLELRRDGAAVRVWRQTTPLDDPVTLRLAGDKVASHELLARSGLPVPEHFVFDPRARRDAAAFVAGSQTPCFVKPAADTAVGTGVTGGVRTASQLARAALRASRYDRRLLVERQVPGDVHRVLVLDGDVLDAVRRRPPSLVGDGRSSIAQLLQRENERRRGAYGSAGLSLLRVDLDLLFALDAEGLALRSVPADGAVVRVKTVTSQNRLEDNECVTASLSDDVRETAARAAAALGLRLAGVDLVTTDAAKPLAETDGAVLEVNGTPGFNQHYLVSNPQPTSRVAVPVLERLLAAR
jgi:D-alanine-D-alanine ligase-like ATP-grasp enzyme